MTFLAPPPPGVRSFIEHMFDTATPVRTALFEEIRQRLKRDGKRDDIVILTAWLLASFLDDGKLRPPSGERRKTIVLDGVTYWLVRCAKRE